MDLKTGLMDVAGKNGFPSNLYAWDYKKFAPRLGLAYQPFKDSKTVIRGGAGIFYDNVVTFNGLVSLFLNPPFRAPATYTSSVASPITLSNPFPLGSPSGNPAVAGITRDYTTPNVYEWSLGVQRQLAQDVLLDVTYLGSKGVCLPDTLNLNQPAPGPGTAAQVQARRPYPAYANFTIYESGNQSSYQLCSSEQMGCRETSESIRKVGSSITRFGTGWKGNRTARRVDSSLYAPGFSPR